MKLGRFSQTPLENKTYIIDYSQWLGTGETIVSVTATVQQVTTPPFQITGLASSMDKLSVSFFASGGVDGTEYEVEFLMTSSTGQIKNDQVFYAVRAM